MTDQALVHAVKEHLLSVCAYKKEQVLLFSAKSQNQLKALHDYKLVKALLSCMSNKVIFLIYISVYCGSLYLL
jgi:hypothetical protein